MRFSQQLFLFCLDDSSIIEIVKSCLPPCKNYNIEHCKKKEDNQFDLNEMKTSSDMSNDLEINKSLVIVCMIIINVDL